MAWPFRDEHCWAGGGGEVRFWVICVPFTAVGPADSELNHQTFPSILFPSQTELYLFFLPSLPFPDSQLYLFVPIPVALLYNICHHFRSLARIAVVKCLFNTRIVFNPFHSRLSLTLSFYKKNMTQCRT